MNQEHAAIPIDLNSSQVTPFTPKPALIDLYRPLPLSVPVEPYKKPAKLSFGDAIVARNINYVVLQPAFAIAENMPGIVKRVIPELGRALVFLPPIAAFIFVDINTGKTVSNAMSKDQLLHHINVITKKKEGAIPTPPKIPRPEKTIKKNRVPLVRRDKLDRNRLKCYESLPNKEDFNTVAYTFKQRNNLQCYEKLPSSDDKL